MQPKIENLKMMTSEELENYYKVLTFKIKHHRTNDSHQMLKIKRLIGDELTRRTVDGLALLAKEMQDNSESFYN